MKEQIIKAIVSSVSQDPSDWINLSATAITKLLRDKLEEEVKKLEEEKKKSVIEYRNSTVQGVDVGIGRAINQLRQTIKTLAHENKKDNEQG